MAWFVKWSACELTGMRFGLSYIGLVLQATANISSGLSRIQKPDEARTKLRGSSTALRIAREVKDQVIVDILIAAGVKE
jgi:hypothetical protein